MLPDSSGTVRVVCESCGETLRREPRQLGDPFEVYDDCPDSCGIRPGEFMEWEDESDLHRDSLSIGAYTEC